MALSLRSHRLVEVSVRRIPSVRLALLAAPVLALAAVLAACGSAGSSPATIRGSASTAPVPSGAAPVESNPPGDIPDNVAYVPYTNSIGRYSFVHPEGWVRSGQGATVRFTDKLNGITATTTAASAPPTVVQTRASTVPSLSSGQPAFQLVSVRQITLPGGTGVLVTYRRNSAPDPVTGKVFRDEVQRYEVFSRGHQVTLELYGAVGSDNVDPYAKISQSLRLS